MLDDLIATTGVREIAAIRSSTAVLALHGGLEHATYEMADAIAARSAASLYSVVQPDDFFWHVPSTEFDPDLSSALRLVLEHVEVAISLHGFGREGLEDAILLGGSNRQMAGELAVSLRTAGLRAIDDLEQIPQGLRGLHPANPVNLPVDGGVQLEMSAEVRRSPTSEVIVEVVGEYLLEMRTVGGGDERTTR